MDARLNRAVLSRSRPAIRAPAAPSTSSTVSACCSPPTTSLTTHSPRSRRRHQPSAPRRSGSSHRLILPESHGHVGVWGYDGGKNGTEQAGMGMIQVHKLNAQGATTLVYEAEVAE